MTTMTEKPAAQPAIITPERVSCYRCGEMIAHQVTRPYKFTCRRCKAPVQDLREA